MDNEYGYAEAYLDLKKECKKEECGHGCSTCYINYALAAVSLCIPQTCSCCKHMCADTWCEWHDRFEYENEYKANCKHWELKEG